MDKKTRDKKSKSYWWTQGRTLSIDHNIPACLYPDIGHQVGATLENNMVEKGRWCNEEKAREYDGGGRNTFE